MVTRHAANGGETPLCGSDTPDSSGEVVATARESDVDCADCAVMLGLHVCGLSDLYQWCDGCRLLAADSGLDCW